MSRRTLTRCRLNRWDAEVMVTFLFFFFLGALCGALLTRLFG